MRHKWLWLAGAAVFALCPMVCVCDSFLLTGHFFPVDKIDKLQSPVAVVRWSEYGLMLADGQTIGLPGLTKLPKTSEALQEVIQRGVEIGPDGRVYGLVKIHHWCGNDPVRNHIAKVDIAHMLMFLREGGLKVPLAEAMFPPRAGSSFSRHGWNVSDYSIFLMFERLLLQEEALPREQQTRPSS